MSLRSILSFRVALGLALAIHLDWHVARPTHHRLSLGWSEHWLLAVPVFLLFGWYLAHRWPTAPLRPAVLSVALGVLLGQVVEPIGESLFYGEPLVDAFEVARLQAFATFLAAGLATLLVVAIAVRRSRSVAGPTA